VCVRVLGATRRQNLGDDVSSYHRPCVNQAEGMASQKGFDRYRYMPMLYTRYAQSLISNHRKHSLNFNPHHPSSRCQYHFDSDSVLVSLSQLHSEIV
jgi:hypothetical protein